MIDQRRLSFDEKARTFCFAHEGYLTAAQIMAEHHLRQVLVLNEKSFVVGSYEATPSGIQFQPLHPPQQKRTRAS